MKTIKKIIFFTFLSLIIIGINTKVNATSATIKSNKTTMKVGETATITVSVDAASWNIKVTGAATLNEADSSSDGENTKKTFTTSFKATKAGKYEANLSGDITDGTTMLSQNVSGSVKIEVTEETNNNTNTNTNTNNNSSSNTSKQENKVSTDATLKNLGITPNDFTGFQKSKTSYNVTVPYSTEKVNVYAKATDSKATITGTGTKTLKVGSNSFSVKVTAEDKKTTKTYTLNITRKEEDDSKTEEKEEKDDKTKMALGVYKLTLTGIGDNDKEEELELNKEFERTRLEYICNVSSDIKKVAIKAEAYDYNDSIKIKGNENELKSGENLITVSVSDGKDTITYKITVNKKEGETQESEQIQPQEENSAVEERKESMLKRLIDAKNIIIGGFIFLVVLEILIVIYLKITKNKEE